MTAAQQRKVQRLVHLAGGLVLLVYMYAPAHAGLQSVVSFLVFPLLVATGIAMWQAPRVRRMLKSVSGRGDPRSLPRSPEAGR